MACLVAMGDNSENILIVNNNYITCYFNSPFFSFIENSGLYDDLIVLPIIILIRIFSKGITKIRGYPRVAFLPKKRYFYIKYRY